MGKKHKYVIAVVTIVLLIFIFAILPNLALFRGEIDIDLTTGRYISRYYICNIKVSEKIVETELSGLVSESISEERSPIWQLESEWSDFPLKYSKGGGLLSNCNRFVRLLEVGELNGKLNQEQKIEYVRQFLDLLETADAKKIEDFCENIATIVTDDTIQENQVNKN